jgi:antitoxin (DNA-binding transcriptional repressor) of toxin-antitoxin stability system
MWIRLVVAQYPGETIRMSELATEETSSTAGAAREAAGGQVVYVTVHGKRVAGIVPAEVAVLLEHLSADQLDELSAVAADNGFADIAVTLEDLADRAAVVESRADPGPGIPWEQIKGQGWSASQS